jgi:hypothetical protein
MSWTVACFCGNIYTTPPDCCEVCGRSTEPAPEEGMATSHHLHTVEIATALATTRAPTSSAGNATRREIVSSKNDCYHAGIRHGVSTVTGGQRTALGVIFHDAK